MLKLNEIERDYDIARTPHWWSERNRREAIGKALEQIPALVAELTQAREELAAVDASLGGFYAPVLDPKTEEPCGSFWKDHGVNVMRDALELAQAEFKRLLHVQAERGTLSALIPLYRAVDDYLHNAAGNNYIFIHHNYDGRDRLAALREVFLGMSADVPPAVDEELEQTRATPLNLPTIFTPPEFERLVEHGYGTPAEVREKLREIRTELQEARVEIEHLRALVPPANLLYRLADYADNVEGDAALTLARRIEEANTDDRT